jgi:hypothetical protein
MPYNPETQATLVVDKPYHSMLKEIVEAKGQTLRRGLEILIEREHQLVQKDYEKTQKGLDK